jgi:hypothetical protein
MTWIADILFVILVEILAFHSPTASLWLWTATALLLLRRALLLHERTHLFLSACGAVFGALGSVALALLAWRGYTVSTFPGRWQLYSVIWLGATLSLQLIERYTKRVEWSQVAEAVAGGSLWDLATSRRIPDLRSSDRSTERLGA